MSKSKQFPWFTIISSLIVIAAFAVPSYLFYRHWKAGQREDFMWVARGQLELMKGNKSVEFLEVSNVSCKDDTLDVIFQSGWAHLNHSILQELSMESPSLLLAYSCVSPASWDTICKYLDLADIPLRVTYHLCDTTIGAETMSPATLKNLLSDENKKIGLKVFSAFKLQETLDCAKYHYRKDPVFTVDSLALEDDFVTLHLSYDDNKYNIIRFLDPNQVNDHFTDDVKGTGSILDNMLEICVRTGRGFAFVYTGSKKHKVNRLQWDYSRIDEYVDAKVKRGLEDRRFNSVHTIVHKTKRNNDSIAKKPNP